jgi:hypothetical protein
MTMNEKALATIDNRQMADFRQLAPELAVKGLDSNHSRIAYQRAIVDFIELV